MREHIRFDTCVEGCDWRAQERQWQVAVSSGSRRQLPLYARWFRFLMFWRYGDGLLPFLEQDPDFFSFSKAG